MLKRAHGGARGRCGGAGQGAVLSVELLRGAVQLIALGGFVYFLSLCLSVLVSRGHRTFEHAAKSIYSPTGGRHQAERGTEPSKNTPMWM